MLSKNALERKKLAGAESSSIGPNRALFRSRRLRAVAIFRRRFGEAPIVRDMQHVRPKSGRVTSNFKFEPTGLHHRPRLAAARTFVPGRSTSR